MRAPLRGRRKRGSRANAFGRSRGRFGTKLHLRADGNGLPLGELAAIVDAKPKALIGDCAYDSNRIRADLLLHGIGPVIPARRNRTNPPPEHDRKLYRERKRIERLVGHFKESRRLATPYDKTTEAF